MSKILVTGAAGFIGSHVTRILIARGDEVVGLDNLNDYYDPRLKEARLDWIRSSPGAERFRFVKGDIADREMMPALFAAEKFDGVVHLAAQAGVRHSLKAPHDYIDANVTGFLNILEGCRHNPVKHLVYASTSSVYGANEEMPYSEEHGVAHQLSLYAATKKANESMAHSYSHLFRIPCSGLRFFTVYGPWGRPDMALFLFTKAISRGEPIQVFNHGRHKRDFTFVEDIAEGVVRTLDRPAAGDESWGGKNPSPASSRAPWRIFNIGNAQPVELLDYIRAVEKALGKTAKMELLPLQPGDVPDTWADSSSLVEATGYRPATDVDEGVRRFVEWYQDFYAPRFDA
ncbi:MAG: hypothetical protein RL095_2714 [Verrucomicrobiota bacterium]|jgi:UDP-glucuronate 4-epimerase